MSIGKGSETVRRGLRRIYDERNVVGDVGICDGVKEGIEKCVDLLAEAKTKILEAEARNFDDGSNAEDGDDDELVIEIFHVSDDGCYHVSKGEIAKLCLEKKITK